MYTIWDRSSPANRADWYLKTELLISFVIDFIHLGYYYRTRNSGSIHFRLFHPIIFHYNEKRKLCDGLTVAFQYLKQTYKRDGERFFTRVCRRVTILN